ncbi:hypothetical protein CSKR_102803 [Clonorchis sinensis]|uniref:Uncharacterized protein n=1 Tax=Clonorchis sinensis TaxID=79923 RepID=A0A3R7H705_CLOSI|nr:hypothetical protein CSKR_102803 [Clonorchis sinensis]
MNTPNTTKTTKKTPGTTTRTSKITTTIAATTKAKTSTTVTPQITTQPTTQKSAYTQTTKPEISWQTSPKSTADTKSLHNTEIDQTVKSSGTTILSNPISSSNTTTREGVDRSTRNIHDKSESPNSTEINPTDSMVPTTKKSTSNRTQPPEHIPATWPSKNTSNTDNPETHEPMETSNPTNVHESQSSILADTETAGTTLPSTQMSSFIPTEASDHISPMNSSITHNASDQNKNPQTEENVDRSTGNIQHASESPISTEANTTPSSVASTQQSTSDSTEPANHSSATWVSWNTSKTGQIENTMTDENVEPSMGTTRQESQPPTPTNTHNERSAMSSAHQSFVVETATPLASLQTSSSMEVNETSPTVNTEIEERAENSKRTTLQGSQFPSSINSQTVSSTVSSTHHSFPIETTTPGIGSHTSPGFRDMKTGTNENTETEETVETSTALTAQESQSSILADTETAGTTLPSTQMSSFIPTEASDHISPMNSSITHNASDQNKNPQTEENVDRSTGNIQHASESPISTEANTTPSSVASTQQSTSDSTEPANHSSATWVSWNTSKTGQIENTMTDENVEPSMGTTRQESQPPTPTNTHNERSAMSSAHQSFVVETATPLASLQTSSSMEVNETSPTVNTEIEERAENSKRTTLQGSQFPSSINSQTVSSTVSSTHHSFSIETTLPYVSSPSPSEINFYGTSSVAKAISDQTFESSMGRALDVSNYPRYTDNLTGRSTAISANYVFSVQSAATYNSSQTSPSMRTDVFSPSMNTSILRNSTRLRCTRSGGYSSVPFVVIYIVSLLVACLN